MITQDFDELIRVYYNFDMIMFLVMFVWSVVICILPHLFVFISFLFFNLSFLFTCLSLAGLSFVIFFVHSLFKQCVNLE